MSARPNDKRGRRPRGPHARLCISAGCVVLCLTCGLAVPHAASLMRARATIHGKVDTSVPANAMIVVTALPTTAEILGCATPKPDGTYTVTFNLKPNNPYYKVEAIAVKPPLYIYKRDDKTPNVLPLGAGKDIQVNFTQDIDPKTGAPKRYQLLGDRPNCPKKN
jgi:hypothetical protein